MNSSSDSRYFQLYIDGTVGSDNQRLYSKLNADGITTDGKKGPQSFSFESSDITTYNGKTYLHFKDNNTEMKVTSFTVTLTKGTYAACTDVAAPTDLTCSAQGKSSLTYTWTKASNASGYTATLYSDSECTTSVESQTLSDVKTVTFNSLGGSTTYYCKVQSNGDGTTYCAEGGVTNAVSGTTLGKDYTVTASSNNNGWGTATADAGSLDEGEETDVTATASDGYKFDNWSVSGTGATLSSTTTNPTTLTMGTANATVTATFRVLETYAITYDKGTNGTGTIDAGEKTEDVAFTLSTSTFTREGYLQTGWSLTDGGEKAYNLGGNYTDNAALTLYPFWTASDTQTDVTGYSVWDWSKFGTSEIKLTDTSTPKKNDYLVLSNAVKYGLCSSISSDFGDAQALNISGEYLVRDSKYFQGGYIKFNTTVPGVLTVTYSNTGNRSNEDDRRFLNVNGTNYGDGTMKSSESTTTSVTITTTGEITIKGTLKGNGSDQYLRISKVVFTPTVTATVGAKGYATYCNSTYALDFTGKSISAYTISSTDGSALTLTKKDKVAKNEPVLLYSSKNSDSQSIPAIADAEATADSSNKLVAGTGDALTWSDGAKYYILYTGGGAPGFYQANNSVVAVGKAYLDLTGLSAGSRSFTLNLNDETTGIAVVKAENGDAVSGVFDLQGRHVAQPTKGMYIVNGKKVIIK